MKETTQRLLGALKEYEQYLLDDFRCQHIPKNIIEASEYDYRKHDGKYWKIDEHTYVINGEGMIFIVKDWKLVAYKYQAGSLGINPVKDYPHLFLAFEFENADWDDDVFVFNALTLEITTVQNKRKEFSLIKE